MGHQPARQSPVYRQYAALTREYVPTVYAKLDDVIRTIKEGKWRQTVREKRESANSSESVGSTADY